MVHWIQTAFSTYVLHSEHGNGYQWHSGIEGNFTILVAAFGLYKHHQCEQPWCLWPGHVHPDHGRPVCRRHYHHDVVPQETGENSKL